MFFRYIRYIYLQSFSYGAKLFTYYFINGFQS